MRKNKINLYWYKHKNGFGNFGDELNWYIVKKISGKKINYVDIKFLPKDKLTALKYIIYALIKRREIKKEYFFPFKNEKVVIGIGSVISWYKSPNVIIWGAGLINSSHTINNAQFNAVRGEETLKKLKSLNYNIENIKMGDPALLLPLLYKPKISKKYNIGIIPHYIHYESLKKYENENMKIINLLNPIEQVIDEINSCDLTLSTSLHGLIVSHAYNIPSLWIAIDRYNQKKLLGDDIKFLDYFSSVGIEKYNPINIDFENIKIELLKQENIDKMLIIKDLKKIQKDLINVAPFPIQMKFKKLI